MVEISSSGSGEGPREETTGAYSTAPGYGLRRACGSTADAPWFLLSPSHSGSHRNAKGSALGSGRD
jgi:hypothetical protein